MALSVIVEHECKKSSRTLHKSQSAAPSLPAAARSILRVHRRPLVRGRRQDIAIRDDKIHCEVGAVSPIPLADPGLEREIRGISASTGHALRIAPSTLAAFDGMATAMAGGLESLDVFIDLGAGEASEPELLFEGTAREVGLRFPEGVNVVIAAALAGPGLDATHVRVMRPPRGSAGRTMGFTVRSRVGVFELMAKPRVVRAEDIHTVAASLLAMLRRETTGIVIG